MAGRIHVDPFLRFPYYANNFLLLYSALFIFKLSDYCQFLTWLCGLLTSRRVVEPFRRRCRRGREAATQQIRWRNQTIV
ncbi:MAG: hypothetical protein DME87_06945, partial [Verrucomicrobia bacterium]